MATIFLPRNQKIVDTQIDVTRFLSGQGIAYQVWQATHPLLDNPTQADVLLAYDGALAPFMQTNGYQTADVIHLTAQTPNYNAIRAKFLAEHTHTEDEVRFFVKGSGDFWFHLHDQGPEGLFAVRATAGDLLAVPMGIKHWFDAGLAPNVTVIRLFTDPEGWVAHYTGDAIADNYTWTHPHEH
jgi:1,2-dihydroxy-3-keto-5-methylthiopentene dioxygenase